MNDYYKNLPGKRVGAGALLFNEQGELLIVKPNYKDYWLIPGGTVDKNESPRQACLREVKEEIGLELEKLDFVCVDYTTEKGEKTESFQFIFNGGILTGNQVSAIILEAKELDEYKFIKIEEAVPLFSEWFGKRLVKCITEAIKNNKAIYLEDGK
jgi:8-oxo-dGTP diphosphatase